MAIQTVTIDKYDSTSKTGSIIYMIGNGVDDITAGLVPGDMVVNCAGTITEVTLLLDTTGSIVVDIWKETYSNYPPLVADSITASAKPTVSAGIKYVDDTLTGWTKTFSSGDIFRYNVDSASGIKSCTVVLKYTRTF